MQLPHEKALSRAKIQLMSRPDSAFYSTLCFSMTHIFDDTIPTACAGGTTIRYNPKFFMGLLPEEQLFLVLHEVDHIAYLHNERFVEGMCHDRANIAMDHVINLQLIEAGFKMPANGHADPRFKGMNWEAVYKLLPDNPGKPRMSDLTPTQGKSDPAKTREIQDILIRAAIQSKLSGDAPGSIPGDIQIYLNGLLSPKLPWNRLLIKYLREFDKNDYSFRKLNRRFFPKWYLPGMVGEKLMSLAIGIDISGSVSKHDFHVFVSEVASILRMMKPPHIDLIQFDTKITSIDRIKNIKDLQEVKFSGRGGTAIEPLMAWAEKEKPQLLLVFTDGQFRFHIKESKTTTLWLIHNGPKFTAPFGKVIHYTI